MKNLFKDCFVNLVFLFVLQISFWLFPSLLNSPNYLGVFLIVMAAAVCVLLPQQDALVNSFKKLRDLSTSIVILGGWFLILYYISEILLNIYWKIDGYRTPLSSIIYLISIFVIFSMRSLKDLKCSLELYTNLVFVMALFGVTAWVLINFNIVDPEYWKFNLSQATMGKESKDSEFDMYSFPYYLGLILTGSYKYKLFGFEFYRASGFTNEPNSGAFFVTPALFYLLTINKKRMFSFIKIIFCILFLLCCASLANFFFLTVCLILWGVRSGLLSESHEQKISVLSLSILFFSLLVAGIGIFVYNGTLDTGIDLIDSKFDIKSATFLAFKNTAMALFQPIMFFSYPVASTFTSVETEIGYRNVSFLSILLLIMHIIFILLFSIRCFFSKNSMLAYVSITIFYIIMHALKGSIASAVFTPFYCFFLCALLHIAQISFKQDTENKLF